MKKNKYSLKKVYESVFKLTKEDRQADINADFQRRILARNPANAKTLKDLYAASNDDDVINQTISTEIPGLGTFDLTPVKIGLLGCIDQYYYGDKQLALNLINILNPGQSIEPEQTSQRVTLAAGYIRENENNDSSGGYYNLERVKKFLNHCVQSNVLDNNLKIIKNKSIHFDKEYNISRGFGFLFEYFVCLNLDDNKYETNIKVMLQNKINVYVIYVVVILKIINDQNLNVNSLNSYNIFDADVDDIKELYKKLDVPGNIDFINNQIHPEVEKQKLNFIFNINYEALDIIVKYDQIVICYLDIKTTANNLKTSKGEYYCIPDVSSNKDAVKKFNNTTRANNQVSENLNIGMLNFNYVIKNNKIKIRQIKSMFNKFSHIHDKIMTNKKVKEYQIPYEDRLTSGKTYIVDNQEEQFYFINETSYSIDSDKTGEAIKKEMQNDFKELVIQKLIKIKNNKKMNKSSLIQLLRGKTFKEYDFTRNNVNILVEIIKDIINDSNNRLSNVEDLSIIYKEMFIINNKFLENNIPQYSNAWGTLYSKERFAYALFKSILEISPTGNFQRPQSNTSSLASYVYKQKRLFSKELPHQSLIDVFTYAKNSLNDFIDLLNTHSMPADYIINRINNTNAYLDSIIKGITSKIYKTGVKIDKENIVGINILDQDETKFLMNAFENIEKYLNKELSELDFNKNQRSLLANFGIKDNKLRKKIKSNLNSLLNIKTCLAGTINFNGLQNNPENIEKRELAIKYSIEAISDRIKKLNRLTFNVGELFPNINNREYNIINSFLEREVKGLSFSNNDNLTRALDSFWEKIKKQSEDDIEIISAAIKKYKTITPPIDSDAREILITYVESLLQRGVSKDNSNRQN